MDDGMLCWLCCLGSRMMADSEDQVPGCWPRRQWQPSDGLSPRLSLEERQSCVEQPKTDVDGETGGWRWRWRCWCCDADVDGHVWTPHIHLLGSSLPLVVFLFFASKILLDAATITHRTEKHSSPGVRAIKTIICQKVKWDGPGRHRMSVPRWERGFGWGWGCGCGWGMGMGMRLRPLPNAFSHVFIALRPETICLLFGGAWWLDD